MTEEATQVPAPEVEPPSDPESAEAAPDPVEAPPEEAEAPAEPPAEPPEANEVGTITTVVGTGERGYSGDGGPAIEAELNDPYALTFDTAGNLYIGEDGNDVLRKVDQDGVITTVAGTAAEGYSGDGGPATEAGINDHSFGFDGEGNFYILQFHQPALRVIDLDGIITTMMGDGIGAPSLPEEGSRMSDSTICSEPLGPVFDAERNTYISRRSDNAVIKIDSVGIITTVAGTGEAGFSGDGGPATEAQLSRPHDLAIDSEGNLYFVEIGNERVRKVDASGIITTLAGTGTRGYSGDGGPATEAEIARPWGIAVDADGNVYFTSQGNDVVRKIDQEGIITTVAGTGEAGFSGDGGPATEAALNLPVMVAFDADGNLHITDHSNQRVRRVILAEAGGS